MNRFALVPVLELNMPKNVKLGLRAALMMLWCAMQSLPVAAQSDELSPSEIEAVRKLIPAIKERVVEDFKDPTSALFRRLFVTSVYRYSTNRNQVPGVMTAITVCGDVNGKNSYGAYVGYRKFLVVIIDGRFERVDVDNERSRSLEHTCDPVFLKLDDW